MSEIFESSPGFCVECGSILPLLKETGGATCYQCKKEYPIQVFGKNKVHYTIHFNSVEAREKDLLNEKKRQRSTLNEEEGPVIERKCPKCNNDRMSYATLQLRSADEGQTVFFTCTKCKYKESENS